MRQETKQAIVVTTATTCVAEREPAVQQASKLHNAAASCCYMELLLNISCNTGLVYKSAKTTTTHLFFFLKVGVPSSFFLCIIIWNDSGLHCTVVDQGKFILFQEMSIASIYCVNITFYRYYCHLLVKEFFKSIEEYFAHHIFITLMWIKYANFVIPYSSEQHTWRRFRLT